MDEWMNGWMDGWMDGRAPLPTPVEGVLQVAVQIGQVGITHETQGAAFSHRSIRSTRGMEPGYRTCPFCIGGER